MYFSGFADEAANGIVGQIQATKALGWRFIESRNINGQNIHDLSDEDFEIVQEKLANSDVRINCFGSTVANWSKNPLLESDFIETVNEIERAIPKMQKLGTTLLRGMSFKIMTDYSSHDSEIEKQVITKVKDLVKRCEDGGIIYAHENCMNYGGQSYQHSLKLIESIDSKAFRLCFDTHNPAITDFRIGNPPYCKQSSWEFYQAVKEYICHVHIKDGIFLEEDPDNVFPKVKYTYPGEGEGDVYRIIKNLIISGYSGALSIEPHMEIVFHGSQENDNSEYEAAMMQNYIEYGQRTMQLVEKAKKEIENV